MHTSVLDRYAMYDMFRIKLPISHRSSQFGLLLFPIVDCRHIGLHVVIPEIRISQRNRCLSLMYMWREFYSSKNNDRWFIIVPETHIKIILQLSILVIIKSLQYYKYKFIRILFCAIK